MISDFKMQNSIVKIDNSAGINRWLDAWGDVKKFIVDAGEPADDTTNTPTRFISTAVGTSPLTVAATAGNSLLLTTGGTEYNGLNVQARGAAFSITSGKPFYFGAKIKASEATNIDLLVGLAALKTDLLKTSTAHGVNTSVDGVFFAKIDGAATITAKSHVSGAETATANVGTLTTGDHIFEIFFDGDYCFFYIDGELVNTLASGLPTAALTPSLNVRAGDGNARTLTVAWMRCIQVLN